MRDVRATGALPIAVDVTVAAAAAAIEVANRLTMVPFISVGSAALRDGAATNGLMLGLAFLAGAVLVARRRAPVAVLVVAGAASCLSVALRYPLGRPLATCIALLTVAMRSSTVVTALAGVALALCLNLSVVIARGVWQEDLDDRVMENVLLITLACLLGWGIQLGRARTSALREQADRLSREHAAVRERALQQERARIARELHDVVAHHLSVITAQAAGAQRVLDTHPDRARQALAAIETTGRGAMTEMRRLLGLLQGSTDAAFDPQPTLDQLPALIARTERAGLPVRLTVSGTRPRLPPGMELNAFRIVQEALTNTLKHAGPARAHVDLAYEPERLRIRVTDDGRGLTSGSASGRGLLGMRERTALHGGELAVAPGPDGGVEVVATLPLEEHPPGEEAMAGADRGGSRQAERVETE